MPLQLVPTLGELNIEQLEAHLEGVRVRRLSVAIAYQAARSLKLSVESNRLHKRLDRAIDLLGKDIVKLDMLLTKCQARVQMITLMQNEGSFISSMIDMEE
jgi:hypothetical protein